jgi:transcriptional regulator with XRE-family HTH domain
MELEFNRQALEGMRRAKGWTYAEFARRMGCSPQYVYALTKYRYEPQMRTLNKISAALGIEPTDLLKEKDA